MRNGKLRERVIIEQPQETRTPTGGVIETWGTFAEVYASIRPLRGKMLFAAQQVHPETTTEIGIRYLAGLTPKMRVRCGRRIYVPTQPPIDLEMRHREMQLMCKEIF